MKTLLIKLTLTVGCLATSPAFAHPTDEDTLEKIGTGTQLVLREDINVPASVIELKFQATTATTCRLVARESNSFDRVLAKGEKPHRHGNSLRYGPERRGMGEHDHLRFCR